MEFHVGRRPEGLRRVHFGGIDTTRPEGLTRVHFGGIDTTRIYGPSPVLMRMGSLVGFTPSRGTEIDQVAFRRPIHGNL